MFTATGWPETMQLYGGSINCFAKSGLAGSMDDPSLETVSPFVWLGFRSPAFPGAKRGWGFERANDYSYQPFLRRTLAGRRGLTSTISAAESSAATYPPVLRGRQVLR